MWNVCNFLGRILMDYGYNLETPSTFITASHVLRIVILVHLNSNRTGDDKRASS